MIAQVLSFMKLGSPFIGAVGGFIKAYRWWIIIGAAVTLLTTVLVYVDNHGEMKATIVAQHGQIDTLNGHVTSLNATIERRNATIARMNLEFMALAEAEQARLRAAKAEAEVLREERDRIAEELGVARFELVEAIRDDEDFADWVDWDVPPGAWSLLRAAAEGGPNPGVPDDG